MKGVQGVMDKHEEVASDRKVARRVGVVAMLTVAAVPAFASTAPTITVDYGAFGTEVIDQVQTMLTAILPAAAVLFGTIKGISWLRGIL